jgi:heptosyltransferase II
MKIAIQLPNWVGDACMATPTIRALREGIPSISELCLVGKYAPVEVLAGNPWSDSTVVFQSRPGGTGVVSRRQMIGVLKRKRIDMIILLPNSLSAGLIGYLSGATRRVGYSRDARSWLLTDRIPLWNEGQDMRVVPTIDYYLNIAKSLACSIEDQQMRLWVLDREREIAETAYDRLGLDWKRPTVVMNCASGTGESRLWPTGLASRAARELASKYDLQVVVHCGPADRARANAVEFGASHPLVKSIGHIEDLPIGLSKAILEQASVVVSTDSGPRHMAVALGKKVVTLFGPTSPDRYRTYNVPERILRVDMDCSPCGKSKCPLMHNNCMHGITYPQVVQAVLEALDYRSVLPRSAA